MKNWKELNMYGSSNDRLEAFLGSKENAFAILQLDDSEESIYDRFESLANLRKRCGRGPAIDRYRTVYIAPLDPFTDLMQMLEQIYERFNISHPEDFRGYSLSVSDIVAVLLDGCVRLYYVDSVGFRRVTGTLSPLPRNTGGNNGYY